MDDFDIEMGDAADSFPIHGIETDEILPEDDAQEPGEVDETPNAVSMDADDNKLVLHKIHIRGLDTMTPDDVKTYFNDHSGGSRFERIEWVNDTAANLLFASEPAASDALISLAAIDIADPSQLPPLEFLPAKPYPAKPDATLQVRFAVTSDRKIVGAAAQSRFYLLHPEFDPEERQRRGGFGYRGKYRDRERGDGSRRGDRDYDRRYYRRNGSGRHDDRYDDEPVEKYDASMYDDEETGPARRRDRSPRDRRRRYSRSPSRSDSRSPSRSRPQSGGSGSADRRPRQDNSGKELFPDRHARDWNGGSSRLRDRSASPARNDDGDERMEGTTRDNWARDASSSRNRVKARAIKDRLSATNSPVKELFPDKLSSKSGGGSVGKAQMDQVDKVDIVSKRLSDRIITRPPAIEDSSGSTFNIRGIAKRIEPDTAGMVIKGRATAKELFPEKLGSAGKDLFPEKLEGRGRPRRKAEDLFH